MSVVLDYTLSKGPITKMYMLVLVKVNHYEHFFAITIEVYLTLNVLLDFEQIQDFEPEYSHPNKNRSISPHTQEKMNKWNEWP